MIGILSILSISMIINAQHLPPREFFIERPPINYELLGSVKLFHSCKQPDNLALTYDDGPSSSVTFKLLDILKAENVTATFFVVGRGLEDPEGARAVKRIISDGHELGSHSYSHPRLTELSNDQIQEEIQKTENIISSVAGKRPTYFRAPYGLINENIANIVISKGYKIVDWSIDSKDWDLLNSSKIQDVFERYAAPKESYNILFHDIFDESVAAQKHVIKKLRSLGYRFVKISECIADDSDPISTDSMTLTTKALMATTSTAVASEIITITSSLQATPTTIVASTTIISTQTPSLNSSLLRSNNTEIDLTSNSSLIKPKLITLLMIFFTLLS